jgi:hypothetical protein
MGVLSVMAMLRQLTARLSKIQTMWRKVHVLSAVQSLIVASISAGFVSIALTIELISREQNGFDILVWPDTLSPCINFSIVLIGVISPLLGYYHLGRLGFLLNMAAGLATAWLMAVCAILCFILGDHYFGNVWFSFAVYLTCVALAYMIIVWFHLRAAKSSSLREAQQKLRLL